MSDWELPEIPEAEVSIDDLVDDKLEREQDYEKASTLISNSISASSNGDSQAALEFLQAAADLCPLETTIWILMGDSYRELGFTQKAIHAYKIGAAYGDFAARARLERANARSVIDDAYDLLDSDHSQKISELRNLLLDSQSDQLHWAEYRDLAKKIHKQSDRGSGDLSWALLNKSLQAAMSSGAELHTIYTEMGNQLYQDNKYPNAIQSYILAYLFSPTPPPKYLRSNLEKCFKRLDNIQEVAFDEFFSFVKSEGSSDSRSQASEKVEKIMQFLFG